MRFRTMAVAAALMTALAAPAAGSAAGAASGASAAQSQAAPIPDRFRFTFDNRETLAPNSLVRDVTGHRHPGTVLTIDNGSLSVQKDAAGRAAGFPGACKSCGRAIIAVPDAKGLDPGVRPFTFGAWVKVTKAQTQHNSNIVQKGFFHQKGGQWKLQLNGHLPNCVLFGRTGRLKVTSSIGVSDGKWHNVSCSRSHGTLVLRVDGTVRGRAKGRVGSISNVASVRVGGKGLRPGNDQFHGVLDGVYLNVT